MVMIQIVFAVLYWQECNSDKNILISQNGCPKTDVQPNHFSSVKA